MAKYNIIKNGLFTSNTSSGTGNKALTLEELSYLTDGNVTVPTVTLTSSDILYLDIDLGHRIKVNGIFLYTNDSTQQSHIDFYYKDYETDEYTICTKISSPTSYSVTIPEPSAPQFVRCTVSGVDIELIEFSVFNDDNIVSFGEDGTESNMWLSDTPLGEEGDPQALEIYNNSDSSYDVATAYACVDFKGKYDSYIKISDKISGPYTGFEDNVLVGSDLTDWNLGTFVNTKITNNMLVLDSVGSSNVLYERAIKSLPLNSCTHRGSPFGTRDGMCYDHVNNIIYMAFYTGTNDTNGLYQIYSYDPVTNITEFKANIDNGYLSNDLFSFTCDETHLYFTGDTAASYLRFYKHEIDGAADNLTQFAYSTITYSRDTRKYMVADFKGNIFVYAPYDSDSRSSWSKLLRIDTTTGTITERAWDIKYTFEADSYVGQLVYSFHDDTIHFINSNNTHTATSRFNEVINTWNSIFFNYGKEISTTNTYLRFNYFDGNLFFIEPSYGNYVYRYDITKGELTHIDVGLKFHNGSFCYLQVVPAMGPDYEYSFFMTGIENDRFTIYGFNTPHEAAETVIGDVITGEGTYTTSVIPIEDPYRSSYFIVKDATIAGASSVSTDATVQDGTIEIRSSSVDVEPLDEIYWLISNGSQNVDLYKYTHNTGVFGFLKDVSTSRVYDAYDTAVCRKTGYIAICWRYSHYSTYYYIAVLNRAGSTLWSSWSTYLSYHSMGWDGEKGLWVYNNVNATLNRFTASNSKTCNEYDANGFYEIAPDLNGTSCWLSERTGKTLKRVSYSGSTQLTVYLNSPYGVCSTEDNCCWVIDLGDPTYGDCAKKYNSEGEILNIITLPEACYRMTHDHEGGFYTRGTTTGGRFYHFDAEGVQTLKVEGYIDYDYIRGGKRGFITYNYSERRWVYVDRYTGEELYTMSQTEAGLSNTYGVRCPDIFPWDQESEIKFSEAYGSSLLPLSTDPVWYEDNNLPWVEVPKDGYFLPNHKNYQVRLTLRNYDGLSTPYVSNIAMAPAVKIEDIAPDDSKPMYIRSTIPAEAQFSQFNTRVKVWWSKEG